MIYGRFTFTSAELDIIRRGFDNGLAYAREKLVELRTTPPTRGYLAARYEDEVAFYESAEARQAPYRAVLSKIKPGRKVGLTEAEIKRFWGAIGDDHSAEARALVAKFERPFALDKSQDAEPDENDGEEE